MDLDVRAGLHILAAMSDDLHSSSRPLSELLESHGIQPTAQRLTIARILFAQPQHLSADEVLGALREENRSVSKATVYNTLGLFVRKGLIREVSVDRSRVFYDSNPHPHHHFYDTDTGELTDIPRTEVEFKSMPALPEGAEVEGVDVVVRIRRKPA